MREALKELTKEQVEFICNECNITEARLNSMSESELYNVVYEAMCDIEIAEIPSGDEPESERCIIASDIVTLLGNTMMEDDADE